MGMAASQARYLGLTARKTNVEYEGQQVNQQRTALANQSAGLFSQIMGLNIPTPPSSQDFTKVQYSYNDGTNTQTLSNITPLAGDPNFNYTVTHTYTASVYTGVETTTTNPQIQGGTVGGVFTPTKVGNSPLAAYNPSDSAQLAAVTQIKKDLPASTFASAVNGDIFTYQSSGNTYFACRTDLKASYDSTSGAIDNQSPLHRYNATNLDTPVSTTEKALLQVDSNGQYTSAKLQNSSPTYNLNASTTTDQNAYNDAMNKYNYDTAAYQKSVEDLNAQTSIIQQEDRTL